jgi:GxxExxY protein
VIFGSHEDTTMSRFDELERVAASVVDNAFKLDLLIDDCLIIELKSIERLAAVHGKQLLTYLRLSKMPLGILMNFGQATFKDGLRRIANDYYRE